MIFILLLVALIIIGAIYQLCFSVTSQVFGSFPYENREKLKFIALSFDDGPNGTYTEQLADILKKHAVLATFFQVGTNIERYPDVTCRLVREGHTIGNHLYWHRFRSYFNYHHFRQEFDDNQKLITKLTGQTPNLYRPPWLFRTPAMLRFVHSQHMTAVSGLFGNKVEIFQPSAARIVGTALKTVRPGSILIFHDGYNGRGGDRSQTAAAIDLLIPQLKQAGYTLVTVDKLLGLAPYRSNKLNTIKLA